MHSLDSPNVIVFGGFQQYLPLQEVLCIIWPTSQNLVYRNIEFQFVAETEAFNFDRCAVASLI